MHFDSEKEYELVTSALQLAIENLSRIKNCSLGMEVVEKRKEEFQELLNELRSENNEDNVES